jgi:glutamine synthetase
MDKVKLEYIWLDGYQPEPSMRSKTKIASVKDADDVKLDDCPVWAFDGSSTQQAEGHSSDCLLIPAAIYPDTARHNGYLVLCEVQNAAHEIHPSNTRGTWDDEPDLWVAFEQEYFLMQEGRPLGFPLAGYPGPQGPYYCSAGAAVNKGREIVEEHLDACLDAGIEITGINAEVAMGQWEFQCFGKGAKKACDDLWTARYLLVRTAEAHGVNIELHPKPVRGDWNGSGMHTNFSNTEIRTAGSKDKIIAICEKFRPVHEEHIAVYGAYNELRLTGLHETQSIDTFNYGVSDRGASIRIPVATVEAGWKGYLEDRRPASNADPYKVVSRILKTLNS